jgi:geranylgeranyl pyrophosphate synthase
MTDPVDPAINARIDDAVSRIVVRTSDLGGSIAVLGQAIWRAASGGKRLRPRLVLSSYRAFAAEAAVTPAVYTTAAAFELLHTAFVVHDDVIDNDTHRRGIPNVSGEFLHRGNAIGADATGAAALGDAAGILAGDLLLHEASRLIAFADVSPSVREELFALLDDAVFVSAAGELADVENSIVPHVGDASDILNATFQKTAVYTFSAPLRAGAVLAAASPDAIEVLDAAGGQLGLAFQLVDDLIGAFGSEDVAGRPSGGDLREAKRTPLVARAQQSESWPRVHAALAAAHTGPVAVRDAQLALEDSGARDDVLTMINDVLSTARDHSWNPALPAAAGTLIRSVADSIAARIP